mmetsp:Transcript_19727/g.61231  ORF Transcript_19727/g.61231 Transcript_19727/m.61231 type:complete len:233 (+) Transcript_19727:26-724(+)
MHKRAPSWSSMLSPAGLEVRAKLHPGQLEPGVALSPRGTPLPTRKAACPCRHQPDRPCPLMRCRRQIRRARYVAQARCQGRPRRRSWRASGGCWRAPHRRPPRPTRPALTPPHPPQHARQRSAAARPPAQRRRHRARGRPCQFAEARACDTTPRTGRALSRPRGRTPPECGLCQRCARQQASPAPCRAARLRRFPSRWRCRGQPAPPAARASLRRGFSAWPPAAHRRHAPPR